MLLDHRGHRRFYTNKSEQECRAQGPPIQRHVTTTASCRSHNWPVVRASVGESEVNHSTYCRPSKNHVKLRSGGRLASRRPTFRFSFYFLAPCTLTKKVPKLQMTHNFMTQITDGKAKTYYFFYVHIITEYRDKTKQ